VVPYVDSGWGLGFVLAVLLPLIALLGVAWLIAAVAQPSDNAAERIARERFASREITAEQLGVLLHAL
jgi:uncharacterized membrane protein